LNEIVGGGRTVFQSVLPPSTFGGKLLEFYQFEACPYSRKVQEKLSELEIDYLLRNVSKEKAKERG
jgi:hypothetical protein